METPVARELEELGEHERTEPAAPPAGRDVDRVLHAAAKGRTIAIRRQAAVGEDLVPVDGDDGGMRRAVAGQPLALSGRRAWLRLRRRRRAQHLVIPDGRDLVVVGRPGRAELDAGRAGAGRTVHPPGSGGTGVRDALIHGSPAARRRMGREPARR